MKYLIYFQLCTKIKKTAWHFLQALLMFAIMLILNACAVGPDYVKPSILVPQQFKEVMGKTAIGAGHFSDWKIAEPKDDINRGEWWTIFADPTLNELEHQLNHMNQTIVVAAQNYQQAQALADQARAAFFPTVTAVFSETHQKQANNANFINSASTNNRAISTLSNVDSGLLNSSWELDVWGSVRRSIEANTAGAQASAAVLAATQLSQQASLAQYYFELRGVDADQGLLDRTVANQKKALQLTQHQYTAGVASQADIVQAQSQLQSVQATAINNGILRAQYEHAIATLIGLSPAVFSLTSETTERMPPAIPLMMPSSLLERRPDIAQAERLMAQANAEIGVAIAGYFPTLTLSANSSSPANQLFSAPFLNWGLGVQAAEMIFNGGLRSAQVRAAKAAYQSSVASYRQTVLTAFQEVEDNLAALRILTNQAVVQNQAVASARTALNLVNDQYKAGIVAYASVIVAQTNAYAVEKNAVDLTYLRMTSAIGLIKALGGGWHAQGNRT